MARILALVLERRGERSKIREEEMLAARHRGENTRRW